MAIPATRRACVNGASPCGGIYCAVSLRCLIVLVKLAFPSCPPRDRGGLMGRGGTLAVVSLGWLHAGVRAPEISWATSTRAVIESFWARMQVDLINRQRWLTRVELHRRTSRSLRSRPPPLQRREPGQGGFHLLPHGDAWSRVLVHGSEIEALWVRYAPQPPDEDR